MRLHNKNDRVRYSPGLGIPHGWPFPISLSVTRDAQTSPPAHIPAMAVNCLHRGSEYRGPEALPDLECVGDPAGVTKFTCH